MTRWHITYELVTDDGKRHGHAGFVATIEAATIAHALKVFAEISEGLAYRREPIAVNPS